jgi:hypothetical protein
LEPSALSFVLAVCLPAGSSAAVSALSVSESSFQFALATEAVWQAAGRTGVSGDPGDGVNELGLADLGTAAFVYSVNFHDWDIVIGDIGDLTTPQATSTPISLVYDPAGNLTFSVGPTAGFSTTIPLVDQVTAPFSEIWIGVWSDHVQTNSHVRFDGLTLDGEALGGLDAWGEPLKAGSQPFDGIRISGLSDPEDWTLEGTFVIDYSGDPLPPGRDDARFVIFGTAVPEPSALVLGFVGPARVSGPGFPRDRDGPQ